MSDLVRRLDRLQKEQLALHRPLLAEHIDDAKARIERLEEALFKIDRMANSNRKDKAARISKIVRQALQETGDG